MIGINYFQRERLESEIQPPANLAQGSFIYTRTLIFLRFN